MKKYNEESAISTRYATQAHKLDKANEELQVALEAARDSLKDITGENIILNNDIEVFLGPIIKKEISNIKNKLNIENIEITDE